MAIYTLQSGRQVDTGCPWSSDCWANQGCYSQEGCPDTLLDVLRKSAVLEHEQEVLPHTDPDIIEMCPICKQ